LNMGLLPSTGIMTSIGTDSHLSPKNKLHAKRAMRKFAK